jgi:hypothetical protein
MKHSRAGRAQLPGATFACRTITRQPTAHTTRTGPSSAGSRTQPRGRLTLPQTLRPMLDPPHPRRSAEDLMKGAANNNAASTDMLATSARGPTPPWIARHGPRIKWSDGAGPPSGHKREECPVNLRQGSKAPHLYTLICHHIRLTRELYSAVSLLTIILCHYPVDSLTCTCI